MPKLTMIHRHLHHLVATTTLALAALGSQAAAIPLDLAQWNPQGDVSVQTGQVLGLPLGTAPTLVLGTASLAYQDDAPALAGAFNVSGQEVVSAGFDLEAGVGLAPGALDDATLGPAYEGSSALWHGQVQAGDTIAFNWRLLTTGHTSPTPLPDTAWVIWQQGGNTSATRLADTENTPMSPISGVWLDSGWQGWRFTATQAGAFSLGFAVADVNSFDASSVLAIQHITQTSAVPEPGSVLLVLAGLAVMLFISNRQRAQRRGE